MTVESDDLAAAAPGAAASGGATLANRSSVAAGSAGTTVAAVIVSHDPDRRALGALAADLCRIGVAVLVIDNSESDEGCAAARAAGAAHGAEVRCNGRNLGVAAAQNIGLQLARARGFALALLLDQDSLLEPQTVPKLVEAMARLRATGEPVAAVGASFVDPRSGERFPFVRLKHVRMGKAWPAEGEVVECDLLISSGCLIALDAVEAIGGMDGSLFIDYVDIEWCLRARSRGYKVFGVADARMYHTIGDRCVRVLGRHFNLHSPVRHYYFVRNALLLLRAPYLAARWRMHLLYRTAGQLALFGMLAPGRRARLPWLLRGLRDGVLGRRGRLGGPDGLPELRPLQIARRQSLGGSD